MSIVVDQLNQSHSTVSLTHSIRPPFEYIIHIGSQLEHIRPQSRRSPTTRPTPGRARSPAADTRCRCCTSRRLLVATTSGYHTGWLQGAHSAWYLLRPGVIRYGHCLQHRPPVDPHQSVIHIVYSFVLHCTIPLLFSHLSCLAVLYSRKKLFGLFMILLLFDSVGTHPLHDARFSASIMNLQFFLLPCMHGEDRVSGSVFDDNYNDSIDRCTV